MTFAELKARVLEFSMRPDLTGQVASFISLAEGLIRRDLQAAEYTTVLDESDRVADGVYSLPVMVDIVRVVRATGPNGKYPLSKVGLDALTDVIVSANPSAYTVNGDDTIEIRGVPVTDAEFDLKYFGHPEPLDDDSDTNDLLARHEALYVYGSLFHLYQYTQDVELAQAALDTFNDALTKLNEAAGRKLGGGAIAGPFYFGPARRGY